MLLTLSLPAATLHVDVNSPNPAPPYADWSTAATTIQHAIEAATDGDLILVTNGVYQTGGQVVNELGLTNRVAITKPVTVQSVNGPAATFIVGYQVPGTTNGDEAVRCIYLTNNAALSGFTLTQGATRASGDGLTEQCGGGIYSESTNCIITNCVISGNAANNAGGGASGGTFLNCSITGNVANGNGGGLSAAWLDHCTVSGNYCGGNGGGADACTLTNSLVTGNTAYNPNIWNGGGGGGVHDSTLRQCELTFNNGYGGGGAQHCTLDNCLVASNSVTRPRCGGGGIENSIASNCTIIGNHSEDVGGGVDYSALTNCIVANNHADGNGGGYWGGWGYHTLNNCLVSGNSAGGMGGGVRNASLYNCTVVGNLAAQGGGVFDCSVYNSLIYHNDAAYDDNHIYSYFENSCAKPMPVYGTDNINAEPQLADTFHLSAGSPCRAAGNPVYAVGVDFDGESWGAPPDIGCDQYHAGTDTGLLATVIQAGYTNVTTGFVLNLTAQITGHAGMSLWNFGDGTTATNLPFVSHAWSAPGDYVVTLTAYNGSNPGGVSTTAATHVVASPMHYVALSSVNPVAPYTSWDTAATNIQDAVDAATIPGAMILVSNGVYNTGGQIVFGILSNRVAVTKPVTLQSVNGAAVTTIRGNPVVGDSGVRCLWLTNGSALRGFTISQGATRSWNGDEPREISGGGVWCQSINVAISDCTFISNSASWDGGGLVGGTVSNCVFVANSAGDSGGGAAGGLLMNCIFTNNSAIGGGGVWGSEVFNSYFLRNTGGNYGGGADESELHNSVLFGNNISGARDSVLYNCSLIANNGIGVHGQSKLKNCLVFYNFDNNGNVNNYSSDSILNYCCAAPLPANGIGNISTDPQLSDWFHLTTNSPCRGAGGAIFASGVDIDGEPWLNPPSVGADEYHLGAIGALTVTLQAGFTNIAVNFADTFTAQIIGHAGFNQWDFGDGTTASNRLTATHSWVTPGDYVVTLTVYNNDNPGGVSATASVHVVASQHYVAQGSLNPVAPFSSWATAATNIQDAVSVAAAGGAIFVSNGVYQAGGGLGGGASNRIAATLPLAIQSINGPAQTVVDGTATMRCVYLTNGALLSGFTLTNGNGGGVTGKSLLAVVSNCVIVANSGSGVAGCTVYNSILSGNSAYSGGGASGCLLNYCLLTGNVATGEYGEGGGAAGGTLNNCVISNNAATGAQGGGGGVGGSTLNNCLVIGNSARYSGGVDYSTINNCTIVSNSVGGQSWSWGGGEGNSTIYNSIIYYNNGPSAPNIGYSSTVNYCCAPDTVAGPGNFTNAPLFVNLAGSDYHLQTNSPCINAGNNSYVATATDFDGNPRIVGSVVDIGAFEFQSPLSVLSYAWLQQYGLPTDGTADYADTDGTGMNNWQKWIAGLNPTNPASVLAMQAPVITNNATGVVVSWSSVNTRTYYLQRATDLSAQPAFSAIQSNLVGQAGTTSFTDTSATNGGPYFYRVGVQ